MNQPIVFLDFDGVLHPESCSVHRLFEKADLLGAVIAQYNARVVVSSTWRMNLSISALRMRLGQVLGKYVVGATPYVGDLDKTVLPDKLLAYPRHAECVAWMRRYAAFQDKWVALDDRAYLFYPFFTQLVQCDSKTGLTAERLDELKLRLGKMT